MAAPTLSNAGTAAAFVDHTFDAARWPPSTFTSPHTPALIYNCTTNNYQRLGLPEGSEIEPGTGEEAGQQPAAVLHPFQPGAHQRGQLGDGVLGQVGQRP